MRIFILLLLMLFSGFSTTLKASTFLHYETGFSSEKIVKKSSSDAQKTKTSTNKKHTKKREEKRTTKENAKEEKKIAKNQRKELRKALWKSIKEQGKLRKENRKNGNKDANKKIHWAAYLAFFGALAALLIFVGAIAFGTMFVIFEYLASIALLLLPISIISGIIGVSVALNDDNQKFDKSYTLLLAILGGGLALLMLLSIILIILALSTAFG